MTDVRPAPFFIGESTALDFANSTAKPRSTEFEWLSSGEDVLDWLTAAGLAAEDETSFLKQPQHHDALDAAAKEIRAFREDFRGFVSSIIADNDISADDEMIACINHLMQQCKQSLRLVQNEPEGAGLDLKAVHDIHSAKDLLPHIAMACAEFIAKADLRYVRRCEGSDCTLFFLDVSKNHKRRWCSMEVCGNRSKAAAHRKRS